MHYPERIICFCILLLILSCLPLAAQHVFFNQYDFAPHLMNPGLAATDDQMRISAIHRNHNYGDGLVLQSASIYMKYPFLRKEGNMPWASIDLAVTNDGTHGDQLYQFTAVQSGIVLSPSLGKGHYLSMGFHGQYGQKSLDFQQFTTGSQWVPNMGFNEELGSGEGLGAEFVRTLSFHSGFLWHYQAEGSRKRYYAGAYLFHINRPSEQFLSEALPLDWQWTGIAGVPIAEWLNQNLHGELMYRHMNGIHQVGLGPTWSYFFENVNPFQPISNGHIEVFSRYFTNQVASVGARLFQENYALGFSYDRGFAPRQNWGAVEVSLSLFIGRHKTPQASGQPYRDFSLSQIRDFYESPAIDEGTNKSGEKTEAEAPQTESKPPPRKHAQFELRKDFKYGFNQYDLNDEAKSFLDDLANFLKANPALKLKVTGHTDDVGTKSANRKVSYWRAQGVKDYLVTLGIDERRISIEGKGFDEPLVENDTEVNRAKNRRTEFIIYQESAGDSLSNESALDENKASDGIEKVNTIND